MITTDETIYTRDEAALLVDLFENILDQYDIKVPSPEDDERCEDNEAKLYGSTYSDLLDSVEDAIVELLQRAAPNRPYIIEGCFSGMV